MGTSIYATETITHLIFSKDDIDELLAHYLMVKLQLVDEDGLCLMYQVLQVLEDHLFNLLVADPWADISLDGCMHTLHKVDHHEDDWAVLERLVSSEAVVLVNLCVVEGLHHEIASYSVHVRLVEFITLRTVQNFLNCCLLNYLVEVLKFEERLVVQYGSQLPQLFFLEELDLLFEGCVWVVKKLCDVLILADLAEHHLESNLLA